MKNDVIYDDVISQNGDKKKFFYKIFKLHMITSYVPKISLVSRNKPGGVILPHPIHLMYIKKPILNRVKGDFAMVLTLFVNFLS